MASSNDREPGPHERREGESIDDWYDRLHDAREEYEEAAEKKHDRDTRSQFESVYDQPYDGESNLAQAASNDAFDDDLRSDMDDAKDADDNAERLVNDEAAETKKQVEALEDLSAKLDVIRPQIDGYLDGE